MNKTQSSYNKFFSDNAIKQMPQLTSYSSTQLNTSRYYSLQNQNKHSKRNTQSTVKLNPKTFHHRQVFNTKLYQNVQSKGEPGNKSMKKFFTISLNKEDRIKSKLNLGDEQGIYFTQISKIYSNNNFYSNTQLSKMWNGILHNTGILQKYIRLIDNSQPIKYSIKSTMQSIQTYLIKLSTQINKLLSYKKQQQLNITNLKRKKQIIQQQQLQRIQAMNVNKLKQEINQNNIIAKCKAKINMMDFEVKKLLLKNQKLEQQLKINKQQNNKLRQQNKMMRQQKQGIDKWKQDHDYKIKKLKQQLQVAHIVKEQSLQDKLNYILS